MRYVGRFLLSVAVSISLYVAHYVGIPVAKAWTWLTNRTRVAFFFVSLVAGLLVTIAWSVVIGSVFNVVFGVLTSMVVLWFMGSRPLVDALPAREVDGVVRMTPFELVVRCWLAFRVVWLISTFVHPIGWIIASHTISVVGFAVLLAPTDGSKSTLKEWLAARRRAHGLATS